MWENYRIFSIERGPQVRVQLLEWCKMSEQSALCQSKEGNWGTDLPSLSSVWNPQGLGQGWEKREKREERREKTQGLSLNSLWCSRWYLVTKCKWELCNLQIQNVPVKNAANSHTLPPLLPLLLLDAQNNGFMGKGTVAGSCQTSPGNIIKQHLSFRKPNFNKLETPNFFRLTEPPVFPHWLTPPQLGTE